jgi:Transposase DDE domain
MHQQFREEKPVVHAYSAAFRTYVQHLSLPWSKPQRGNLIRLAAAFLVARGSLPIRRLARALAGPGEAHRYADHRLRAFLGNKRLDNAALDAALGAHLGFLLPRFGALPFIPVVVDWLFTADRAILWIQIPYRGRSLPLCVTVQAYALQADETGRTEAEEALLQRLGRLWPKTAAPPLLLMDRGFDKGPLLRWLLNHDWRFIVRIQRGHLLFNEAGGCLNDVYDACGQLTHAGPLHPRPGQGLRFPRITYLASQRLALHLVVAAQWDPKAAKVKEWRLVTNLPEAELGRVPHLYAQRMHPEGTHRDAQRGHFVFGFALSHLKRLRTDRLERLIFMLGLIYGFLVLVAETERETRAWLCRKRWGLSLCTFALDLLAAAGSAARQLAQRACATVRFEPLWLQNRDY